MRYEPNSTVYIGEIAVDSGTVMITDPCYINAVDIIEKKLYKQVISMDDKDYTPVLQGFSLVVSTTHGDGMYPVIGFTNDEGLITKVMIDFEPPFEDDDATTTEYAFYMIDYEKDSYEFLENVEAKGEYFENFKAVEEFIFPYCVKYADKLKEGKNTLYVAKYVDGYKEPKFRGSYAPWLLEEEPNEEPFYIDATELEEQHIFNRIVNGEE